ncbi:MAG: HlyC/CorC family transporter [Treponema sp.]|nr:HlyC/CorC family transporter [Treponema sp.]
MQVLTDIILPSIAVVVLVGVVAFFASCETAFLSITKMTLRQMLKEDDPNRRSSPARKIAFLKKDTDKLLSLILIGINFVTSLASGLATAVAVKIAGEAGSVAATFIMAFVLIIFGEITPKTFSAVHPVEAASMFATTLIWLERMLYPIVWIFAKISGGMTIILNSLWKNDKNLITEEELKSLIEVGENEGTLEHSEKKMLYKIFDFTDLRIHDIMRHRSAVKFIPANATFEEIVNIFTETGFSRIPVCDGEFDNVLGMIYYKQILMNGRYKDSKNFISKVMQPVIYVPETLMATELLARFKKEQTNFAIAIDENGSNIGIATIDDIMRAVFGRSVHEDSPNEIQPENRITPISLVEYLVPGDMKIDDVNELLDLDLVSDEFHTIAGWLLEQFDELPEVSASLKIDGITYKVEEIERRRIKLVRIKLILPPQKRN